MLKYRLISGSLLVAALLVIVFVQHWLAGALMVAIAVAAVSLALTEYFGMMGKLQQPGYPRLAWLASMAMLAIALPVAAPLRDQAPLELPIMALLLVFGFYQVCRTADRPQALRDLMTTLLGFLYLGWTLSYLLRLYFIGSGGPLLVFYLILTTKCGDIGGYTLGNITSRQAGGNHKMVPGLSPKKSWEGFLGSLLFSAVAGWLLVAWLAPRMQIGDQAVLTPLSGAIIGAGLASLGLFGDLCESVLKRSSGVKDSGSLLPGMGGILDVVDSLVFVAPLFYWYVLLVA